MCHAICVYCIGLEPRGEHAAGLRILESVSVNTTQRKNREKESPEANFSLPRRDPRDSVESRRETNLSQTTLRSERHYDGFTETRPAEQIAPRKSILKTSGSVSLASVPNNCNRVKQHVEAGEKALKSSKVAPQPSQALSVSSNCFMQ